MKCSKCHNEIVAEGAAAGYATDTQGHKFCYDCCAGLDKQAMDETGKATLYLDKSASGWFVSNWPGTLTYKASVQHSKRGHYSPFAGYMSRYDVWFSDDSGHLWHGRSLGDMTQLCHCKRLKNTRQNRADARRIRSK